MEKQIIDASSLNKELLVAAENGNLEALILLHEQQADINYIDPISGATPIFFAAQNGHHNVVEYFISQSADCNIRVFIDNKLITPLAKAIMNGHYKCAKLLLDAKASLLKGTVPQYTLNNMLIFAAEAGDLNIVKIFIPN